MKTYKYLTETQKRWYHALWDETGGAISPAAIISLFPAPAPPTQIEAVMFGENVANRAYTLQNSEQPFYSWNSGEFTIYWGSVNGNNTYIISDNKSQPSWLYFIPGNEVDIVFWKESGWSLDSWQAANGEFNIDGNVVTLTTEAQTGSVNEHTIMLPQI